MTSARRRRAFTMVELLVVIAVIGLLVALLLPAVQQARESARRAQCQGNLRQLGIALNNYQAAAGVYPFGVGADGDGAIATYTSQSNRRYSMHSQLLPYIEQTALFNALNFSVPPFFPDDNGVPDPEDGPGPNFTVAQVWVNAFLCPSDFNRMPSWPWGQVNYRSCNGSTWSARVGDGMFGQSTRIGPANVRDGLSNTAAMSERHPRPRRLSERGREVGPVPPGRALDRGRLHRVVREPCPTPRRSPCRSTTRTRPPA